MSATLIALCGLIYLGVALDLCRRDPWLALPFVAYAAANAGLVMKALGK